MRTRSLAFATLTTFVALAAQARADEVIEIHDHMPAVKPQLLDYHPRKLPAYSDAAVLQDAWARAWLLLDIDATGTVTRIKFLHRPGYDLEAIAKRAAWKLKFSPARDDSNHATGVQLIWGIEWPSQSWLLEETGVASGWPDDIGFPPRPASTYVPCRGAGSTSVAIEKFGHTDTFTYSKDYSRGRDCSPPDTSHVDNLPWIARPAGR